LTCDDGGVSVTSTNGPAGQWLVVIGASAGGVEALCDLVAGLAPSFPAAVVIVLHVPPTGSSALPAILSRATSLPVRHAQPGDHLIAGQVLVAPPDRHVVVMDSRVVLSAGPRENGHRPAVDVLFRSAARSHGPATIAVVLSGGLDDGTAGMAAVRSCGGVGIAQEPADALHPAMPLNAIESAGVDHVLSVAEMPAVLNELVAEPCTSHPVPGSELLSWETEVSLLRLASMEGERPASPSGLSCPDCHGVLFQLDEDPVRLRCRVGHAWTQTSLAAEQGLAVDSALWVALRTLEERAALASVMVDRLRERSSERATAYERRRLESLDAARTIRGLIATMSAANLADIQDPVDPA
jgi:two-component system chemotaxis response regulator CheB